MKGLWKRNAVVTAVVLFLCLAAYLNWSYSRGQDSAPVIGEESGAVTEPPSAEETSSARTLGEAVLVDQTGDGVYSDLEDDGTYFDSARLDREQARDSAMNILQETVDDEGATQEARNTAADSITAMANCSLSEAQIEGLVLAKGYTNCVAYVNTDSASIVVSAPDEQPVDETDVAVITDIVRDETGLEASCIKVIETQ